MRPHTAIARPHADDADHPHVFEFVPVRCTACDAETIQPRSLVFLRVLSLGVASVTTPVGGVYCTACIDRAARSATLFTSLFGWWGLPWGPLLSVRAFIRNIRGGRADAYHEEKLRWRNAMAFYERGDYALAGALAATLARSHDPDLVEAGRVIVARVSARGIAAAPLPPVPTLSRAAIRLQIAAAATVPLLGLLLTAALLFGVPALNRTAPTAQATSNTTAGL